MKVQKYIQIKSQEWY